MPRPARALAALFAASLVLAACGSSDDDDAAGTATAETTTEAAAETTEAEASESTEADAGETAEADIVDTAVAAGDFTTLATALTEADLVDTLKGDGPFTVFAPTDDAFAALPAGTLDDLLADKAQLAKVLTYHVVAGEVTADQVVKLDSATTVEGSDITIEVVGDDVVLNGKVKVTKTDIKASNGVIHVIDGVLLPS
ncbi:MAG: fasciclin domain-containing protein [Acidimicrobiia bacterium]|nr:fasciclin domain-containing protein [Acidimicrobiia bacterium]